MTSFSPTEELILEVLAARYRLGENNWSFHKRFKSKIDFLAQRGYVNYKASSVENFLLVSFTDKGKEECLHYDYNPPILKKYKKKKKYR